LKGRGRGEGHGTGPVMKRQRILTTFVQIVYGAAA